MKSKKDYHFKIRILHTIIHLLTKLKLSLEVMKLSMIHIKVSKLSALQCLHKREREMIRKCGLKSPLESGVAKTNKEFDDIRRSRVRTQSKDNT